jgi:hypothetical protein
MDYNPVLFFAQKPTEGHFVTPTIGPYDYWAIEYGYRPFDDTYKGGEQKGEEKKEEKKGAPAPKTAEAPPAGATVAVAVEGTPDWKNLPPEVLAKLPPEVRAKLESAAAEWAAKTGGAPAGATPAEPTFASAPSGEAGMLREIAGRATEPQLAYATDEDTMFISPDPRSNRFDMGSDPIDWANTRMELVNQRLKSILQWAVKDRESWYYLRPAFVTLVAEKATVLDYVGRYIGGQYFNRAHRGDPNAPTPFVLVEPARQRAALEFIEKNLYSDDFFTLSPDVLNHLAPARWWHEGTSISFSMDFPIHDLISALQWWNLFDRLFPNTIRRIYDAELKTAAPDKLTLAEYLQRVQKACWADATDLKRLQGGTWTDDKPFLSSVRRSLQREYLRLMEPLVRERPGDTLAPDLHAMVQYSLRRLADDLTPVVSAGKADFASQAHLSACKSRIERMLSAELREYEPYGYGGSALLQGTGAGGGSH